MIQSSRPMRMELKMKPTTPPRQEPYLFRAEHINPFITSLEKLFSTLLNCKPIREDATIVRRFNPILDIIALIGLSGSICGMAAISFPIKTALAMVSRLYQKEIVVVDETVFDALGEMINVLAGGAQAILSQDLDMPIDLSIPTVIRGQRFTIEYPSSATWIEIPFSSELGGFMLRITAKKEEENA